MFIGDCIGVIKENNPKKEFLVYHKSCRATSLVSFEMRDKALNRNGTKPPLA